MLNQINFVIASDCKERGNLDRRVAHFRLSFSVSPRDDAAYE